jgi:hypothetical protein
MQRKIVMQSTNRDRDLVRESARGHRFHRARRAASKVARWAVVGALAGVGLGCSGATGPDSVGLASRDTASHDPAEDEIIRAQLAARGFDVSTLEFLDDEVIVEGDLAMSRASLLEGAATSGPIGETIEKGYFRREVRLGGGFIALNLPEDLDPDWSAAFLSAENQWNDACPAFRERAGIPGIIDIEVADLGLGTNSIIARSTTPPAPKITLNARYGNLCATSIDLLTPEEKTYAALHEMGHVLGFEHQPPGAQATGTREVPGTSTGSSYETVMATGGCRTLTTLSEDDLRSAAIVYPSRRVDPNCIPQCEENCLFQASPAGIGLCQFSCPDACQP